MNEWLGTKPQGLPKPSRIRALKAEPVGSKRAQLQVPWLSAQAATGVPMHAWLPLPALGFSAFLVLAIPQIHVDSQKERGVIKVEEDVVVLVRESAMYPS